jgi:hypothetical protein
MSLVRDEGKRIVASGLASPDEFNGLLKNALREVSNKSDLDKKLLLDALSTLHNDLLRIKLPGDFKKATAELEEKLFIILDLPEEQDGEQVYDLSEILNTKEIVIEEPKEDGEEKEDEDDSAKDKITADEVINKLQKIAYELGRMGDHEGAYKIERMIRKIQ